VSFEEITICLCENAALPRYQRDLHQQTHGVTPVAPTAPASLVAIPLPNSHKTLTNPVDDA
jgi:hypothetical protein